MTFGVARVRCLLLGKCFQAKRYMAWRPPCTTVHTNSRTLPLMSILCTEGDQKHHSPCHCDCVPGRPCWETSAAGGIPALRASFSVSQWPCCPYWPSEGLGREDTENTCYSPMSVPICAGRHFKTHSPCPLCSSGDAASVSTSSPQRLSLYLAWNAQATLPFHAGCHSWSGISWSSWHPVPHQVPAGYWALPQTHPPFGNWGQWVGCTICSHIAGFFWKTEGPNFLLLSVFGNTHSPFPSHKSFPIIMHKIQKWAQLHCDSHVEKAW